MQIELERTTKLELEKWIMVEESIMKQKSRVQWLNLGDFNTVFYHACMKNRQARNNIGRLTDSNGDIMQSPEEVKAEILNFDRGLLGSSATQLPMINYDIMKNGNVLNMSQQLQLIRPVSREEVKQALLGINDNKAPGCDGYNSYFFKKTWHIVGEEITAAVQDFFENADMCKAINCTTITLIPKIQNPTNIRDFRPISCCTVLYKLISKVITTRMQGVMDRLVDNCQAVFVPRRLITDNILMSHELVKGYRRKSISPRCMLKIDMQTTYDSVEWSYIEQVLRSLNFPEIFRDVQSVQILHQHFQKFSVASGVVANPNKSCIYFGGVNQLTQQQIMDILGYKKGRIAFQISRSRAVQVKSVLFAIQTFWAQIFILPKKVIQFIETICRRLLWTGDAEPTKKALIAWERLCSPKVAGGLNFIDVALWNEAAICKLLWNICTRKEKLWVHWVFPQTIVNNYLMSLVCCINELVLSKSLGVDFWIQANCASSPDFVTDDIEKELIGLKFQVVFCGVMKLIMLLLGAIGIFVAGKDSILSPDPQL
ncbi:uncharacterized protein LOC107763904 [Nicotiana tabacum]|uniref:Uncharacterized protein LOC107763904 n=1 Tax=Nicotiana tabacum TaxID=4097 RepID=A0AC58RTV2_TOBAC